MQRCKAVATAAAAVLAAGSALSCGGDDEEKLSKSEYLKRGDAICAKINPSIADPANIEKQLTKLRDLPAPEGDEDKVEEIYDAADEGLRSAKGDPQSAAQGNPFEKSIKLGKDYGFTKCGL